MSSPTRTVSSLAVTATSPTLAMERTVLTQSFPDQSTPSNTLLSTSTGVVVQSTLVTPAGTAAPAYGVAVVDPRLQATNVVINPHQYPAVVQTKTPMGVDPMGGYFNQKYTPVLPSLNSVTLEMPKGPATRVNFTRQGESPSHDLVGITTVSTLYPRARPAPHTRGTHTRPFRILPLPPRTHPRRPSGEGRGTQAQCGAATKTHLHY